MSRVLQYIERRPTRADPPPGAPARRVAGFTLVELMAALVLVAIMTSMALTTAGSVARSGQIKEAIADILEMQILIDEYAMTNDSFPPSLAAVGHGGAVDPWGFGYVYRLFPPGAPAGNARKDRFLVPVNSRYDLYSIGPDGLTAPSFRAGESADDVVRANDGAFVGLAQNY